MTTATIHETKTHLSRLLREVKMGRELIITQGHTPVARIVPIAEGQMARPKAGTISSDPVILTPHAWEPLNESDLKEWGL